MARPKNEFEKVLLRLKPGTNARIDEVRGDKDRASFVRQAIDLAVEAELKRRERKPKPGSGE
ncbi:hypothetical protein [Methylobacterium sp. Leaf106]|uniref:hypothetical protein n=1 Tax=Methylobacterium sp. Leaf106 TaxID=1736255 RepID=UPI0006F30A61|nr:hypothetical protein [Methylobacterium sp. Leaf106]KQP52977.1 hypothetical protein ASF34_00980 [Methylobacterium sp. Leaf106]